LPTLLASRGCRCCQGHFCSDFYGNKDKNHHGAAPWWSPRWGVRCRLSFRHVFLFAKHLKKGICTGLRTNCSCGSRWGISSASKFSGRRRRGLHVRADRRQNLRAEPAPVKALPFPRERSLELFPQSRVARDSLAGIPMTDVQLS